MSLASNGKLCNIYAQFGLSAPIWDQTQSFSDQIEACFDPSDLKAYGDDQRTSLDPSSLRLESAGMAYITDRARLQAVLQETEEFLRQRAKYAKDRREFDETIHLVTSIQERFAEDQPVRASTILDLLGRLSCGQNWDCLPEPLNQRRLALDDVIRHVGLAVSDGIIVHPLGNTDDARTYSFREAARAYMANDWMHTPWLRTVIARAMLHDLRHSLVKSDKSLCRWWHHPGTLFVVGSILWKYAGPFLDWLGILFIIAGIAEIFALLRVSIVGPRLEEIISEIDSESYSGRVLAERLERLNGATLRVPSILLRVLNS